LNRSDGHQHLQQIAALLSRRFGELRTITSKIRIRRPPPADENPVAHIGKDAV
jgi:hypothetical protein